MKTTPKILIKAGTRGDSGDSIALVVPTLSKADVVRLRAAVAAATKALDSISFWSLEVAWGDPVAYSEGIVDTAMGNPEPFENPYEDGDPIIIDVPEDAEHEEGLRHLVLQCDAEGFTCNFYDKHSDAVYDTVKITWSYLADLHKALAARTVG